MAENTPISWADDTFNIVWGCKEVSPGCAHCYAKRGSKRRGDFWNGERLTMAASTWKQPLKWNRAAARAGHSSTVFCGSMCDVFEDHKTTNAERERLWRLIQATPNLDWLLLTKRPENIRRFRPDNYSPERFQNVWYGTSVEDQVRANQRMEELVEVAPFDRSFVSCEPLLGPVKLTQWLCFVSWVIVGGESGPNFRPMQPKWVEAIREQCRMTGVAFFFKQNSGRWSGTIDEPGRWGQAFPNGLNRTWEVQV